MDTNPTIELRSEKARKVIGYIPPVLVRCGIMITAAILSLLAIGSYFIPYPENVNGIATVKRVNGPYCYAEVIIPYRYIAQVKENMPVKVELEGYDARIFGYLNGNILVIDKAVVKLADKNYFKVTAHLEFSKIEIKKQMKGEAYILLSDKSVLSTVVESIVK